MFPHLRFSQIDDRDAAVLPGFRFRLYVVISIDLDDVLSGRVSYLQDYFAVLHCLLHLFWGNRRAIVTCFC